MKGKQKTGPIRCRPHKRGKLPASPGITPPRPGQCDGVMTPVGCCRCRPPQSPSFPFFLSNQAFAPLLAGQGTTGGAALTEKPFMPGYQVKVETLMIGGAEYQIRSLLDLQQFSDPDGEAERLGISSATWPLFGLVWPSAQVLAAAMHTQPLEGRRVLEIGAGLALASLVLHQRDADVTASDCHPLAAQFMQENLKLNQLGPMVYQTGHWAGSNPALGQFELIIGSDVLYERDQPEQLAGFIDCHSSASVEVMIVDPDRGQRSRFCQAMAARGYRHHARRADCQLPGGQAYRGRFLYFLRGDASPPDPLPG